MIIYSPSDILDYEHNRENRTSITYSKLKNADDNIFSMKNVEPSNKYFILETSKAKRIGLAVERMLHADIEKNIVIMRISEAKKLIDKYALYYASNINYTDNEIYNTRFGSLLKSRMSSKVIGKLRLLVINDTEEYRNINHIATVLNNVIILNSVRYFQKPFYIKLHKLYNEFEDTYGFTVQVMPDYLDVENNIIYDVKVVSSFKKAFYNFKYYYQMVLYKDVISKYYGRDFRFVFIVYDKDNNHSFTVEADDYIIDNYREKLFSSIYNYIKGYNKMIETYNFKLSEII